VATGGGPADGHSFEPAISADGRYVGWYAAATNLVAGDTNDALDVFVRDTAGASTSRVSVTSDGVQATLGSAGPALSEDGRYVVFDSWAALTGGDANGRLDVYLTDRATGRVVRVSAPDPALPWSGPGRDSYGPAISADGRYVAFTSAAPNLVPDDTNATADVFVWDRTTRQTTLITRTPGGVQASSGSSDPAISGDGRYVAFQSYATDLVRSDPNGLPDVFVWDRIRASTTLVSTAPGGAPAEGASAHPAISADGRFTVYATEAANLTHGDTNGDTDVVLWDLVTGRTVRVTDTPATPQTGDSDYPTVSADGQWIAYTTGDPDLIPGVSGAQDVFLTRMG
jgi:Tol biopolymer transport system component